MKISCLINSSVKNNREGFTLVETLMYLAFMTALLGSFLSFGILVTDIRAKMDVIKRVNTSLRLSLEIISENVRNAEDLLAPAEGQSGATIVLAMPDGDPDVSYLVTDGVLYMREGVGEPAAISDPNVIIGTFELTNTAKAGNRDSVEIVMSASYRYAGSKAYIYSGSARTAVGLRK